MFYGLSQYDLLVEAITGWLPDWLAFLAGVMTFLAAVMIFAIGIYLFTIAANIIASPFNAVLSEKVEAHLAPDLVLESPGIALIIGRSVAREISKLIYLIAAAAWAADSVCYSGY